jgi:hypothetical protein
MTEPTSIISELTSIIGESTSTLPVATTRLRGPTSSISTATKDVRCPIRDVRVDALHLELATKRPMGFGDMVADRAFGNREALFSLGAGGPVVADHVSGMQAPSRQLLDGLVEIAPLSHRRPTDLMTSNSPRSDPQAGFAAAA